MLSEVADYKLEKKLNSDHRSLLIMYSQSSNAEIVYSSKIILICSMVILIQMQNVFLTFITNVKQQQQEWA